MKFVTFSHYAIASTLACLLLITHACLKSDGVFDFLIYITAAKSSIAILNNFAFMCFLAVGRLFVKIFIGRLRDLEIEELIDSGRGFLMDTILFLVLSPPTIDGLEVATVNLLKHIVIVVGLKTLHLIAQIRVAHLFQVGLPRRDVLFRLFSLMIILVLCDFSSIAYFWSLASPNSTFYIWIVFECLGMTVTGMVNIIKYLVHSIDLNMQSGWHSKNTYVFCLDLTHDVANLTIYLVFMVVFFLSNPKRVPIYMMADLLQVLRTLFQRIRSFVKYRQLTRNMGARFQDATEEELALAERCIICRDVLSLGAKKLPCGHIFHYDCAKSWFVQQQSCPTCRADIPVGNVHISPVNPEDASQEEATTSSAAVHQSEENLEEEVDVSTFGRSDGDGKIESPLRRRVVAGGTSRSGGSEKKVEEEEENKHQTGDNGFRDAATDPNTSMTTGGMQALKNAIGRMMMADRRTNELAADVSLSRDSPVRREASGAANGSLSEPAVGSVKKSSSRSSRREKNGVRHGSVLESNMMKKVKHAYSMCEFFRLQSMHYLMELRSIESQTQQSNTPSEQPQQHQEKLE